MVERLGIELRLVQIRSVSQAENEPLPMIPGAEEGDPPTNSFAGNSAFTSGAVLAVEDHSGISTITLTLGAGGPGVQDPPVLAETDASSSPISAPPWPPIQMTGIASYSETPS
jgi:hypothetical protein